MKRDERFNLRPRRQRQIIGARQRRERIRDEHQTKFGFEKKKVFRTELESRTGNYDLFFPVEMVLIYYVWLCPAFSQVQSRSHVISITHKCSTEPCAASTLKTSASWSPYVIGHYREITLSYLQRHWWRPSYRKLVNLISQPLSPLQYWITLWHCGSGTGI